MDIDKYKEAEKYREEITELNVQISRIKNSTKVLFRGIYETGFDSGVEVIECKKIVIDLLEKKREVLEEKFNKL